MRSSLKTCAVLLGGVSLAAMMGGCSSAPWPMAQSYDVRPSPPGYYDDPPAPMATPMRQPAHAPNAATMAGMSGFGNTATTAGAAFAGSIGGTMASKALSGPAPFAEQEAAEELALRSAARGAAGVGAGETVAAGVAGAGEAPAGAAMAGEAGEVATGAAAGGESAAAIGGEEALGGEALGEAGFAMGSEVLVPLAIFGVGAVLGYEIYQHWPQDRKKEAQ